MFSFCSCNQCWVSRSDFKCVPHPVINAAGFLPVKLNLETLIGLTPDESFGPLFDDLVLHQRSEGSHYADWKADTSTGSAKEEEPLASL